MERKGFSYYFSLLVSSISLTNLRHFLSDFICVCLLSMRKECINTAAAAVYLLTYILQEIDGDYYTNWNFIQENRVRFSFNKKRSKYNI